MARNGDARVALIGFPSVGKSTLLGALTATESEAAAYEVSKNGSEVVVRIEIGRPSLIFDHSLRP